MLHAGHHIQESALAELSRELRFGELLRNGRTVVISKFF